MSYIKPFVLNWPGGVNGSDDEGSYTELNTTITGFVEVALIADGLEVPCSVTIKTPEGFEAEVIEGGEKETRIQFIVADGGGGGLD